MKPPHVTTDGPPEKPPIVETGSQELIQGFKHDPDPARDRLRLPDWIRTSPWSPPDKIADDDFHLEAAGHLPTLNASEILAAIDERVEDGSRTAFVVAGVQVDGALHLNGRTVPFPLAFTNCVFAARPDFRGLAVRRLSLRGSEMPGLNARDIEADLVDLSSSVVHSTTLVLANAKVGRLALSNAAVLNPGALALDANTMTCDRTADLNRCVVVGRARAIGATISGQFNVKNSCFFNPGGSALSLHEATVRRGFYLGGAKIAGRLCLTSAALRTIDGGQGADCHSRHTALDMHGARVDGALRLAGLRARGRIRLQEATVGGSVYLTNARGISEEERIRLVDARRTRIAGGLEATQLRTEKIDLADAVIGGGLVWRKGEAPRELNLSFASVGRLEDTPDLWSGGRYQLNGFRYESIRLNDGGWTLDERIRWLCKANGAGRPQATSKDLSHYEQLARVLRASGRTADARTVLARRAEAELRQGDGVINIWKRRVLGIVGYGYRPERAIIALAFVVAAGTGLYSLPAVQQELVTGTENRTAAARCSHVKCFDALAYSLDQTLPILDFGQSSTWTSRRGLPWSPQMIVVMQIGLGWTFATAGIAGVTRRLVKE